MSKHMLYSRERKVAVQVGDEVRKFIFIGLSAEEKVMMMAEAQEKYDEIVKELAQITKSLREVYAMQETECLVGIILKEEHCAIKDNVASTLLGDESDYEEQLKAKTEILTEFRREELLKNDKQHLVDKLVTLNIEQKGNIMWYATSEAMLVRVLHDENRQRLFTSAEQMRNIFTQEVLNKLYEQLMQFIQENLNAQAFVQTPYFYKLESYAKRYKVTLDVAMNTEDFLVEAAWWAKYYEDAYKIVSKIQQDQVADAPSRDIIDDPQAFNTWKQYCEKLYHTLNNR